MDAQQTRVKVAILDIIIEKTIFGYDSKGTFTSSRHPGGWRQESSQAPG